MALDETSQPVELLLSVSSDGSRTLGAQIEDQLRQAIRDRALRPGAGCPRHVIWRASSAFRGGSWWTHMRSWLPRVSEPSAGRPPRVLDAAAIASDARGGGGASAPRARFDFRPSVPDVSTFPRAAWLRSLRHALATITDADLRYGDPRGVECCAALWRTTSAASAASSPIPSRSSSPTATAGPRPGVPRPRGSRR